MRGFAALAAAIREEINFESFKGGDMGGDSTALKEACEARGIALSPSLIFAYHDFVLWFIFNLPGPSAFDSPILRNCAV